MNCELTTLARTGRSKALGMSRTSRVSRALRNPLPQLSKDYVDGLFASSRSKQIHSIKNGLDRAAQADIA